MVCVHNTLQSTAVLFSLHMHLPSTFSFYLLFWETAFFTPLFPEAWMREDSAPGNGRGVKTAESFVPWHTLPESHGGTEQDVMLWWCD